MRRGCPSGKVEHETVTAANLAMLYAWSNYTKGRKVPRRAYKCGRCDKYHLTSMTQEEYDNAKSPLPK